MEIIANESEIITLDASATKDPDGDIIDFVWEVYKEPSTFKGDVKIDNINKKKCKVHIPLDSSGKKYISFFR